MAVLELRGVGKRFDRGPWALDDVSVVIPSGTLTTLLGPSGCGKSTLLRLVAGLEPPSVGTIWLDGRDVTLQPSAERNVGIVFQNCALFPHLDVLGNVMFGLRVAGLSASHGRRRAMKALALMGLRGYESRSPAQLSGGQQQRVALARALVLEPAVLLLDEPLSNLDVRLRRELREEIRELQQRLGMTVVYVTHDQTEAMAVSDRIAVLNAGRVVQVGEPHDTYEHPQSEFVAAFMGDIAAFDAIADDDGSVTVGPLRFRPAQAPRRSGPVRLFIRPEAWHLMPASASGLGGKVVRQAYLGRKIEYHVDTELGSLLVTSPYVESPLQCGSPVSMTLHEHGVSVVSVTPPPDA